MIICGQSSSSSYPPVPPSPQGPHIASVTLAAYECGSTDFPEPPYPDQIVCPQVGGVEGSVSLFSIMSKVRLEACMWVSSSLNHTVGAGMCTNQATSVSVCFTRARRSNAC